MSRTIRYLFIMIVPFLLFGCDFLKTDDPPPLPKPTGDPKTDFDQAVTYYNEGMSLYEQAKTAPQDDKWGLCKKSMWKFRDSEYLLMHYKVNPPAPLRIRDVEYYFNQATMFKTKMQDHIRPGGILPTPDSK